MHLHEKRLVRSIFLFLIVLSIVYVYPVSCGWDQTNTDINVTYEVSPDGTNIHVLRQITFENGDENTRFWRGYYSDFNYFLPLNAKNICAYDQQSGEALKWSLNPEGYYTFNLGKRVWYGQSDVFSIEYDLPRNSNTAVFDIIESGNRTQVVLRTPQYYETDIERKDYHILEQGEFVEFVFPKGVTWKSPCQVTCVNHTDMQEIKGTVQLSERKVGITVRYWEGEDAWGMHTLNTTIQSLILLENVIGFPYMPRYNISITQASVEDTQGYGGFNQGSKGIYLLHTSSDAILIHELSHYWTRECHYSHIWMDEGHADLYTYLVLEKTKPDIAEKRKDKTLQTYQKLERKYDLNLSEWDIDDNFNEDNGEFIQFGYSKAFTTIYTVYEDIGPEAMQDGWKCLSESGCNVDEETFINSMEESSDKDIEYIEEFL